MRRISVYFISLIAIAGCLSGNLFAQDTLTVPLKIKAGAELSGPVSHYYDKKTDSKEFYISADLNEKKAVYLSAGYTSYNYSQYNYAFNDKGIFIKAGFDYNLLKPDKAGGRYWAGIGLHYGVSIFNSQVPSFSTENYWGSKSSSIPSRTSMGHFLEATPGVRAELFKNLSIGWNVSLRMLLYSGAGANMKPLDMPGYGDAGKKIQTGVSYYIAWNFTYKKITVIQKKEEPEEPEDTDTQNNQNNLNNQNNPGSVQKSPRSLQNSPGIK